MEIYSYNLLIPIWDYLNPLFLMWNSFWRWIDVRHFEQISNLAQLQLSITYNLMPNEDSIPNALQIKPSYTKIPNVTCALKRTHILAGPSHTAFICNITCTLSWTLNNANKFLKQHKHPKTHRTWVIIAAVGPITHISSAQDECSRNKNTRCVWFGQLILACSNGTNVRDLEKFQG